MIAYREWRVRVERSTLLPILQSAYVDFLWEGPEVDADQVPEDDETTRRLGNLHGIHAAAEDYPRPGHPASYLKSLRTMAGWPWIMVMVVGAVDLNGKVVEHVDGVLRAEHARILALRVDERIWLKPGCDHDEYGVYDGIRNDSLVLRRLCGGQVHCREEWATDDYYLFGPTTRCLFLTRLPEVERQLLERYEVPRLPEGTGPWTRRKPVQTTLGMGS